jgi:hypothetical protein
MRLEQRATPEVRAKLPGPRAAAGKWTASEAVDVRRTIMRKLTRNLAPLILMAAFSSPVLLSGCSGGVSYYDPYYHDYHRWNNHEVVLYGQWEHDTHRDHMDFNKRNDSDKKAYWDWQHSRR